MDTSQKRCGEGPICFRNVSAALANRMIAATLIAMMNDPPTRRPGPALCRSFMSVSTGIFASLLALIGCSAQHGIDPILAARLESILDRHASGGATVSARVMELPSRRVLFEKAIDQPRMPASNMKLLTSATGLDVLGPDYSFCTAIFLHDGDLHVVGMGDPALGDERIERELGHRRLAFLDEWIEAIRGAGVTRIEGDLIYHDGWFESLTVHPSWEHDDLVHWYAAPVSALNLNDNCIDVTVRPTQPSEPVDYEVVPRTQSVQIINHCMTGNGGSPTIIRVPYADVYVLGGQCPKKRTLQSKPIGDPAMFLADALRTRLKAEGIPITGSLHSFRDVMEIERDASGDHLLLTIGDRTINPLAVHKTAIKDVLWRINQNSQNLFAECLGKEAGRTHDARRGLAHPGSWAGADRAIRGFLDRMGVDHDELVVADCSGLSRENRVTVRIISDLLAAMFDHPDAAAFRASMARPGGNGTLRSRMRDISEHVYAKTGYIRGVRALSGYVHTQEGKWLCFSFIYNDIPGSVKPFNDLQDEACRLLVNWPNIDEAIDDWEPVGDVATRTGDKPTSPVVSASILGRN